MLKEVGGLHGPPSSPAGCCRTRGSPMCSKCPRRKRRPMPGARDSLAQAIGSLLEDVPGLRGAWNNSCVCALALLLIESRYRLMSLLTLAAFGRLALLVEALVLVSSGGSENKYININIKYFF